MNYLLCAIVFISCATFYVEAQQYRAYNVTVMLGGKKFDTVEGKLKLNLIGNVFKYLVPLSVNNHKLEYNKMYNFTFAAPYPIEDINQVSLLWSRKTTIGSLFTDKKIYVTVLVLEPSYIFNVYDRKRSIRRYCPVKSAEGIKPSEEAMLRQNC